MSLFAAALPDFLGGLAATTTVAAGTWALRAVRSRQSATHGAAPTSSPASAQQLTTNDQSNAQPPSP
jgi:hypothetical protein